MPKATNVMPTYDGLMQPLVEALRQLGGSGSIEEIYAKTVECPRRSNFDPPCRLNFDPGLVAGIA